MGLSVAIANNIGSGGLASPNATLLVQPFFTRILSSKAEQTIQHVVRKSTVIFPNGITVSEAATPDVISTTLKLKSSTTIEIERTPQIGVYAGAVNGVITEDGVDTPTIGSLVLPFNLATGYASPVTAGRLYFGDYTFGINQATITDGAFTCNINGGLAIDGTISGQITNNVLNGTFVFADVLASKSGSGEFTSLLASFAPAEKEIAQGFAVIASTLPGAVITYTGTMVGTVTTSDIVTDHTGTFTASLNFDTALVSLSFDFAGKSITDTGLGTIPPTGDAAGSTYCAGITIDDANATFVLRGSGQDYQDDSGGGVGIKSQITGTLNFTTIFGDVGVAEFTSIITTNINVYGSVAELPDTLIEYTLPLEITIPDDQASISQRFSKPVDVILKSGQRTNVIDNEFSRSEASLFLKDDKLYFASRGNTSGTVTVSGHGIKFKDEVLLSPPQVLTITIPAGQDHIDVTLDTSFVNYLNIVPFYCGVHCAGDTTPDKTFASVFINSIGDGTTIIRAQRGASDDTVDVIVDVIFAEFIDGVVRTQPIGIALSPEQQEVSFDIDIVDPTKSIIAPQGIDTTETGYSPQFYGGSAAFSEDGSKVILRRGDGSAESYVQMFMTVVEPHPFTRAFAITPFSIGGLSTAGNFVSSGSSGSLNVGGLAVASTAYDFNSPGLLSILIPSRDAVFGDYQYSTDAGITGSGTMGESLIVMSQDVSDLLSVGYYITIGGTEYIVDSIDVDNVTLTALLETTYTDASIGITTGNVNNISTFSTAFPSVPSLDLTQSNPSLRPSGSGIFTAEDNGYLKFHAISSTLKMPPEMYTTIAAQDTTQFFISRAINPISSATISSMDTGGNTTYILRYNNGTVQFTCADNPLHTITSPSFDMNEIAVIAVRITATTISLAVNTIDTLVSGSGSYLTGIANGYIGASLAGSSDFFGNLNYLRAFSDAEMDAAMRQIKLLLKPLI